MLVRVPPQKLKKRAAVVEDDRSTTAIEEYRRIRAMQDEKYEEMLSANQDKVRFYPS